jgi:phytoene dehydrogenase-like protein
MGRVDAGTIISTASGMLTFDSLMHRADVPSRMKRRVRRAPLSHKAICLQFGLSNEIRARGHLNMTLPMMGQQAEIFAQSPQDVKSPVYFVPTLTTPELAPRGGSVIEMFHPVGREVAVDDWDDQAKERLTESAITALGRIHDLDIVATRVRSPRDFRDRMRLYQGALYGLSPAAGPREQFPHNPPVHGLYLAGQSTYPGYGVAASAMSGIFAAEAVMAT